MILAVMNVTGDLVNVTGWLGKLCQLLPLPRSQHKTFCRDIIGSRQMNYLENRGLVSIMVSPPTFYAGILAPFGHVQKPQAPPAITSFPANQPQQVDLPYPEQMSLVPPPPIHHPPQQQLPVNNQPQQQFQGNNQQRVLEVGSPQHINPVQPQYVQGNDNSDNAQQAFQARNVNIHHNQDPLPPQPVPIDDLRRI